MNNVKNSIPKLRELAMEAATKAYSPYSLAKVGSSVLTEDGEIFSGCNIENSSYGGTVCAERVAIFKAVSSGCKGISALYVYSEEGWPPCGICRQVLSEFASEKLTIIIGDKGGNEKIVNFTDFFPMAFTPEHIKK